MYYHISIWMEAEPLDDELVTLIENNEIGPEKDPKVLNR